MLQNRATLKQIRFSLLSELRQIYTENESDSIIRLILEHFGFSLQQTLLEPNYVPSPEQLAQFNDIIADLRTGKPIQYVLGYTYFCDLKIMVDNHVLIPRPETEEMVEHIRSSYPGTFRRIIDLGTGSGCIALALKNYYPEAEVRGVDIQKEAIDLAERNGRMNNLSVRWEEMDLFNGKPPDLPGQFDLVVSNPPYVRNSERKHMARHVTGFEPESALFVADADPLVFYRAIASFCIRHLSERGEIWTEINEKLGNGTAGIFKREGFSRVRILRDIHGKERYIHAAR